VYACDPRSWGGPAPPTAIYLFAPDRKAERPAAHLEYFKGVLHVDGYAGFERLTSKEGVVLAACWAHTRRKFLRGERVDRLADRGRSIAPDQRTLRRRGAYRP
jgi:hypothetical protein